jgi:hypothetical protein
MWMWLRAGLSAIEIHVFGVEVEALLRVNDFMHRSTGLVRVLIFRR